MGFNNANSTKNANFLWFFDFIIAMRDEGSSSISGFAFPAGSTGLFPVGYQRCVPPICVLSPFRACARERAFHSDSMIRLRCGVILTDSFLVWLREWTALEGTSHQGRVLALEYVRCLDGARAGQAWLEWMWVKRSGLSDHCVFRLDGVATEKNTPVPLDLYLSPHSQNGLRWRFLSAQNGQPSVG